MMVPYGPIGDVMKDFAQTICDLIVRIFGLFPF
jgi:hypothetical protein